MPLIAAEVDIRWDNDFFPDWPLEEKLASSQDGIALNHAYLDMRGMDHADALDAIEEEEALLSELEAADWNSDAAEEVIKVHVEAFGITSALDAGVGALVIALSSIGATPISSCNGGLVGTAFHAGDVPHVLFTAPPSVFRSILNAAKRQNVGLIRNERFAEAFADHLPKLHALARDLIE